MFYFSSGGRSAAFLSAVSISDSLPHVVEGDSGHEQGDGEVTSVPFSGCEKEGGETIRGQVFE